MKKKRIVFLASLSETLRLDCKNVFKFLNLFIYTYT